MKVLCNGRFGDLLAELSGREVIDLLGRSIGTAGGRQAPAPLAATMGTTAARPLSSGPRPRAVDNGWFYVNNSKNN